jgi:UDP-N-acetylmuramoyl-L-alanyl-D-glutamate--2,6-diaminopimelate ligase
MQEYFDAKCKLFSDYLKPNALIVLSSQVFDNYPIEKKLKNLNYLVIGKDVKIIQLIAGLDKQIIEFEYLRKNYFFETTIIGRFQIDNILIAAFLVSHFGINLSDIVQILPKLIEVPGRLEKIKTLYNLNIFVDYAHTPQALQFVLTELKSLSNGRLLVLFGCGGNRDKSKRKLMGQIASRYADDLIITDDNPRLEDPALIRKEIIQDFTNFIEIADRKKAIEYAISLLNAGDILLVAGKGHENYQLIKNEKIYFSDVEVIKSCLKH